MPPESESTYDDDGDDGNDPQQTPPKPSQNDMRELRRKAKAHDDLAAKVAEYEKHDLFRNAGLNPTDPKAKYFVKGYDGELTAEAIKAEAEAAGLLQSQEQQEQTQQSEVEAAAQRRAAELAHSRMDGAGAGATPHVPDATADAIAKLESAKSVDELVQIATNLGIPTSLNRQ